MRWMVLVGSCVAGLLFLVGVIVMLGLEQLEQDHKATGR